MTNEELALKIQAGETAYRADLWEAVRKLMYKLVRPYLPFAERQGYDLDDLIQESYFAMEEAVRVYDPEAGFAFTTYLNFQVKRAARTLLLYWRGQRRYVDAVSLDTTASESEDTPLLNLIPDENSPFETAATDRIQNSELRESMKRHLHPEEYKVLQDRYWQCLNLKETGALFGHGADWVRLVELRALKKLRHFRNEFSDEYCYRHKGLAAYRTSLTSVVEDIALKREELLQQGTEDAD